MNTHSKDELLKFAENLKKNMGLPPLTGDFEKRMLVDKYDTFLRKKLSSINPIWAITRDDFDYRNEDPFDNICFLKINMVHFLEHTDFKYSGKYHAENVLNEKEYSLDKCKYAEKLDKWYNGIPINPPQCEYDGKINVNDGNHRVALCFLLNAPEIIIYVKKDVVDSIKNIQFEVLDTSIDD